MSPAGTGASTNCERCGRPARGASGNPDARLLRRAQTGVCVECGVVLFLQRLANMSTKGTIDFALPDGLRLPHVQEQFAKVLEVGKADARAEDINWERVIELWDTQPKDPGILF